jgi:hypothetical protein
MLGGVVWVVLGLFVVLGYLRAIPGREEVVLLIIALLLTTAGLVGLHALQNTRYGFFGRAGFWIALASLVVRALGAGVYLARSSALAWISYPWGTIGMLVAYGVASMRTRVLPRWYGLALSISMPISLPLGAYGTTLFGLIMEALGYALWSWKGRPATLDGVARAERLHRGGAGAYDPIAAATLVNPTADVLYELPERNPLIYPHDVPHCPPILAPGQEEAPPRCPGGSSEEGALRCYPDPSYP